jgi:hypothetical protein
MTATRASSSPSEFESVATAVGRIARDPWTVFVVRWNWKAALLSAAIRGLVYAVALFRHPEAILRGAGIEMAFRIALGGWWGSVVQALRNARPAWLTGLLGAVALPVVAQALEFIALKSGGVTHIKTAMVVSAIFSAGSVLANFFLMRRGLLLTGAGTASLISDLRNLPGTLRRGTPSIAPAFYPTAVHDGTTEGGIG